MLSESEVMVATTTGEFYVYQKGSKSLALLDSGIDANNIINRAVLEAADTANNAVARTAASRSVTTKVQENDISFPLAAYPATVNSQYEGFTSRPRPLSWFHVNGQEGCSTSNCDSYAGAGECMGVALYAHDAYLHIVDESLSLSEWKTSRHLMDTDTRFDGNVAACKTFFNRLTPGAYVRYGKTSDPTPENGVHSIVFVNIDEGGIWVYECNQSYDNDPTHGCGVHYQYYRFDTIARNYQYVTDYVYHVFTGGNTSLSLTKHRAYCILGDGYLVQSHTGNTSYATLNTTNHKVFYSCCSGYTTEPHIMMNNLCLKCGYTS